MESYQQTWEQILVLIKEGFEEDVYENIFKLCKPYKYENDYITLSVPNALIKYRIENFYLKKILPLVPLITDKKIGFKFVLASELEETNKNESKLTIPDNRPIGRSLSSLYRFSNFEVGESNRFAFITAMKVAENGVKICNPLYIFGDVGLGKTHLMTSIGNFILDNDINANVVYTSSQKFSEDYFIATSAKNGREKIEAFYNKYNQADVLLVDDIQFLEGKTATQEEFFKIFEHLSTSNKQIVLTSDRPAQALKSVMPRLKSRFGWGISVDIKQPDKVLLMNILKNKLKFLIEDPSDVSDNVLSILADSFPTNIRDLEGALRTFVNYCTCMNAPLDEENLYISLESIIPKNQKKQDSNKAIIEKAIEVFCKYYKVSVEDINSSSRKQQVAYARQMLMYLLRTEYNIPLQIIGDNIGSRDHATVVHAVDKIAKAIKSDELIKKDYDNLIKNLKN